MAITAGLTLTSGADDLVSDALSLSVTTGLTAAGTSTALSLTSGLGRKKLASGHAQYTLFDGDSYAEGAHKVYLKNTSTNATQYFAIDINGERMGKLYAGDFAFFPWDANAATNDIKIDPSDAGMTLEYMLFIDE